MAGQGNRIGDRLRRLFGAKGSVRAGAAAADVAADMDAADRRRRHLLNDISSFLMTHRLEVNSFTLEIAHGIVAGENAALGSLLAERVAARLPVTAQWLQDHAQREGNSASAEDLARIAHRLEQAVSGLAATTSEACSATTDYGDALEAEVGRLNADSDPRLALAALGELARTMLTRTRDIQRDLARNRRETVALQQSLADARKAAEIDHLTGLPNRRAFESVLAAEVGAARDSGDPLCVAFIDIDHFKRINDLHGHAAGDRILRTVAKALAAISDEACHVARHGGEEFVALLRNHTLETAWRLLDGSRREMAARRLVNRETDQPMGQVTFSAGVARICDFEDASQALRAADEALYRAKHEGRNRVCIASIRA
jgi:diguanylate cyclase